MSDQSIGLQKAIYDALRDSDDLADLIGTRVFDAVPKGAAFPYVVIGEVQALDDAALCTDSEEIFATLHIWSRVPGKVEAQRIGAAVKAALHTPPGEPPPVAAFMPTGLRLISLVVRDVSYRTDPDGVSTHGVMTVQAMTESG